MITFDFCRDLVYGKKHLSQLSFEKEKYDLCREVQELLGYQLNEAHLNKEENYNIISENRIKYLTCHHKKFYSKLDREESCGNFISKYNSFVEEVVLPHLNLNEALVQVNPSLCVCLPGNLSFEFKHHDSDSNNLHPFGEINFIYSLTDMYETNTVKVEKMPRSGQFENLNLKKGECICFNGNLCDYYNEINKTGKTRMNFNFRVLPLNYYNKNNTSINKDTGKKYIEGSYYKRFFAKK